MIATALAVIIALWANHQSKKQLVRALRIQEQAKMIELLDERVSVINRIEKDERVNFRIVKLLFSEEICEHYLEWQDNKRKAKEAEQGYNKKERDCTRAHSEYSSFLLKTIKGNLRETSTAEEWNERKEELKESCKRADQDLDHAKQNCNIFSESPSESKRHFLKIWNSMLKMD